MKKRRKLKQWQVKFAHKAGKVIWACCLGVMLGGLFALTKCLAELSR